MTNSRISHEKSKKDFSIISPLLIQSTRQIWSKNHKKSKWILKKCRDPDISFDHKIKGGIILSALCEVIGGELSRYFIDLAQPKTRLVCDYDAIGKIESVFIASKLIPDLGFPNLSSKYKTGLASSLFISYLLCEWDGKLENFFETHGVIGRLDFEWMFFRLRVSDRKIHESCGIALEDLINFPILKKFKPCFWPHLDFDLIRSNKFKNELYLTMMKVFITPNEIIDVIFSRSTANPIFNNSKNLIREEYNLRVSEFKKNILHSPEFGQFVLKNEEKFLNLILKSAKQFYLSEKMEFDDRTLQLFHHNFKLLKSNLGINQYEKSTYVDSKLSFYQRNLNKNDVVIPDQNKILIKENLPSPDTTLNQEKTQPEDTFFDDKEWEFVYDECFAINCCVKLETDQIDGIRSCYFKLLIMIDENKNKILNLKELQKSLMKNSGYIDFDHKEFQFFDGTAVLTKNNSENVIIDDRFFQKNYFEVHLKNKSTVKSVSTTTATSSLSSTTMLSNSLFCHCLSKYSKYFIHYIKQITHNSTSVLTEQEVQQHYLPKFKHFGEIKENIIGKLVQIGQNDNLSFMEKKQDALDFIISQIADLKKLDFWMIWMLRDEIRELASADSIIKKYPDLKNGPLDYLCACINKDTGKLKGYQSKNSSTYQNIIKIFNTCMDASRNQHISVMTSTDRLS